MHTLDHRRALSRAVRPALVVLAFAALCVALAPATAHAKQFHVSRDVGV
jgi:photosystem II stability/assembly factor-like uncharacterized protein